MQRGVVTLRAAAPRSCGAVAAQRGSTPSCARLPAAALAPRRAVLALRGATASQLSLAPRREPLAARLAPPLAAPAHLASQVPLSRLQPADAAAAGRCALVAALVAAAPLLLASPAFAAEVAAASGTDFQSAFVGAFLLIFFSEIGDKTFFIAVLLALQQPRGTVFAGTFGALAVMTVISVGLGRLLHVADEALPFHSDVPWDDYAAVALLLFFGVRTLQGAAEADAKGDEEQEDAKEAVATMEGKDSTLALLASTFVLVFAAEWGDKSFLATIALAAASDPVGVVAGAVAGHGTATALAVAGGSLLGEYVSEKVVAYTGGSLFIVFAFITALEIASGNR